MNTARLRSAPMIVAIGFAAVIAVGLVLAYFRSNQPSFEQSCVAECAAKNKFGRVVAKYPPHMVPSGRNPMVCECY
jgi:hypothetical protein